MHTACSQSQWQGPKSHQDRAHIRTEHASGQSHQDRARFVLLWYKVKTLVQTSACPWNRMHALLVQCNEENHKIDCQCRWQPFILVQRPQAQFMLLRPSPLTGSMQKMLSPSIQLPLSIGRVVCYCWLAPEKDFGNVPTNRKHAHISQRSCSFSLMSQSQAT